MLKNLPSLRLLSGFEACARLGNFSRAAEELCLSQSAISHQVAQLETHLGQPLFHRVGRGVVLTVAGEVLLQSVQKSLLTLQHGLSRIGTYMDPGLVVIVCPAAQMAGWVQAEVSAAQAQDPELVPVLSTDQSARFIDEVDVDIHISTIPLQQSGLHECQLFVDQWRVFASAELAQRLAQIEPAQQQHSAGLLCLEQSLSDEATAVLFQGALSAFRKLAIYDDLRLLIDAVKQHAGIALLPCSAVASCVEQGQLQPLSGYPVAAGKPWWIARAAGATRSPKVSGLFDRLNGSGAAAVRRLVE